MTTNTPPRTPAAAPLLVGSLCAGIGGIDLGLQRAGMTIAWQVELDPYCRRVLAHHWPQVPRYPDVREVDPHGLLACHGPVDVVAAGFPCQPVSDAGRRLAQQDPRWLWPHIARLVAGLRPRWVLLENVPGLLGRGMGDVLGDLAALGYDTEWACVAAADLGAPHLRERVWIVAYPGRLGQPADQHRLPARQPDPARRGDLGDPLGDARRDALGAVADPQRHRRRQGQPQPARQHGQPAPASSSEQQREQAPLADAPSAGGRPGLRQAGTGSGRPEGQRQPEPGHRRDDGAVADPDGPRPPRRPHPQAAAARPAAPGRRRELPQPVLGGVLDGLPARLDRGLSAHLSTGLRGHRWPAPPDPARGSPQHPWEPPRTVHPRQVPNRPARVNALGNAVVPQIVELIGRAILATDPGTDPGTDQARIPTDTTPSTPAENGHRTPPARCPRCGAYAHGPVHLLGTAGRWPGGSRPFPPLRWCTPAGVIVLPFDRTPTLAPEPRR